MLVIPIPFFKREKHATLSEDAQAILDDICLNIPSGTDLDKEKMVYYTLLDNVE